MMSVVSYGRRLFPSCIPGDCRAAEADEPPEMNFIRAHSSAMTSDGLENSSARLFSNPAGSRDLLPVMHVHIVEEGLIGQSQRHVQ